VVNYQYDNANRLVMAGGVPVGWDNNGNMTSFGSQTYTYTHANRLTQVVSGTLTTEFTYNGAGDRVAKSVDGVTTGYVLDPAAGLTQVLQETTAGQTTGYLYGHDLLAQHDSGTWAYHVNDGLGSVRGLADPTGQVVGSYSFSPFGVPLGESGGEPYGFTGEQWDASAGLVYLRARYYESGSGRFTQRDPLPGFPKRPQTFQAFVYAYDNPINLTDHSGLAPWVDCTNWPTYLGLRELCQQANGDDNNPEVLDAREAIFETLVMGGFIYGVEEEEAGYVLASIMLDHFLSGGGSELDIAINDLFSANPFSQDPGILRATKQFREPLIRSDEPDFIRPLLWVFLQDYVQPVASGGKFSVGPVHLQVTDYIRDRNPEMLPRPYDRGLWAAVGHVPIAGTFSAEGRKSCHPEGYVIRYQADYRIEDNYKWFEGKKTPFDFPGASERVWIPHEWQLSLVRATPARAHFYHFNISWIERERLLVGLDFSWYRPMAWGERAF
jgi:RHS repeat-associated protein